ncbi:hypothetical protein ACFU5Y_17500 [Streptomyces gardneri]|uniref:hypothetical protein n=1 Tax=Streptomyces gardneri TaxID=66892 RepID=UPI0036AE67FD
MAANGGRGCAGCEAAPWAELTAVRPLGLVVAGVLLGGLAAELTRAARLHRPR